ncbi:MULTISPECIES: DNA-directed RNA polymerase subunit alpha C-terminal domain-containing protein [unclassified Mesorhizobium]|uniref:DNA-directed RNA polymerase subunit alpha C-terminal domain-containing protein n=1 Tax=unclassified Mesorhizobium TaxID=325217 RepID=UPI0011270B76|nr:MULTISPECIES: DNA-directed RNA polymerase subunit alpha C-terminal domain-containing protein [unclassified Mesorhizobium]TPL42578.1 hypothetical protein FJ961_07765 [Mesorhizobium sp. B2-4-5]TPL66578.1 hypothetical protein FJ949_09425 [Mesorhizobium sp. B2-4-1]
MPNSPEIADLELSIRAANRLDAYNITTLDQFMALTKPQVMTWRHAGVKTWREIQEVQENLRGQSRRQSLPGRAVQQIRAINDMQVELSNAGFFLRFDDRGRLRLARYVTKEDFDDHDNG